MKKVAALLACLLFSLPGLAAQPIDVSLLSLIGSPKEFDGKLVRLIGFAHFEFEGNAIYLHREDHLRGIPKNGLWLDVEEMPRKELSKVNNKYVLVEGVFAMEDKGHVNLFSGSIKKVQRLEQWRAP
ncbi:hypothetical protein [Inhella sp.]|uniref:hypothetical protein n=1 Tax=Inhella sp. TaxID=1921806 RepID=UPI0035B38819